MSIPQLPIGECSRIVLIRGKESGGDMDDDKPTNFQLALAVIALTPGPGEGLRLPLPVALARLDRIAKAVPASSGQR